MKRRVSPALTISACLLMCAAEESRACNSGTTTIVSLGSGGSTFQVAGLNSTGQLTGYYFGDLPAHAFLYQSGAVTDLGTLGGMISEGFAINSSGQVVGGSYITDNAQFDAFLYSGGSLLDLGTLGGPYSSASAINDAGQIAGASLPANASDTMAFLYSNGTMVNLGTLGGTYSSAFALNRSGQVAGESTLANDDLHAFVSSGPGLLDLGTLGGTYSSAFSINDAGVVVGESSVGSSDIHGFVFSGGAMTDLGTFGGTFSSAFQVNTNGQVIGIATTLNDAETHAFSYTGGSLIDLGTLGGTSSSPFALNNRGQVVGNATLADGTAHAFLWQNNQLVDLNTLLPDNSGWVLSNAQFINDAGRIVGTGSLNGVSQWFILDLAEGNNPPVAVAGPDRTVDCQAEVNLDGSGSSDPDNDPLTFEWSSGGSVLGTTAKLSVSLPLGGNVVTLKVTDSCGASSQANVNITVADTTPPNGSCPAAATASADSSCQAPVPNLASQVVATDNCAAAKDLIITQSPAAGTLVGLGPHPVAITVADPSGNSSTCMVLFTVVDTTPPVILGTPASFILSAGANCQAVVPNVQDDVTASDSCTAANQLVKSQSLAAGTLIGVGDHVLVITVTDAAGNRSSANVSFKVVDTTAPTIVSSPSQLTVSANANCQGTVPNVLPGILAMDNCTPANQLVLAQDPPAGTVLPHGQYNVQVTVADTAGNSSSVSIPLAIVDATAPVIQSLVASPNVLSPPNHQLMAVTVSALVNDNCDPSPLTKITSITCNEPTSPGDIQITGNLTASLAANKSSTGNTRIYTITVQSTDAAGNSSTGLVTVSVPKNNGSSGATASNTNGH